MRYLADTNFITRAITDKTVRTRWAQATDAGLIAICDAVEAEVLYSARSAADHERLTNLLSTAYPWVAVPENAWQVALNTQYEMVCRGTHRSASPVDLVIAATAEAHNLVVLTADRDFLCIAEVTGQPVRIIPG